MSDHFSQASADLTSALNAPASTSHGCANPTNGAAASSTSIGPTSTATSTSEKSLVKPPPLTSSAAASRVSPSASPAKDAHKPTCDGSGPKSHESFAYYDPESSSWKTSQGSLLEGWETYSATWPRAGTTRSGTAYQLPPSAPLTVVTVSSSSDGRALWPTPRATQWQARNHTAYLRPNGPQNLENAVAAADAKSVGGKLNPAWVEWLMGFPIGWTDLEGLETPSSPKSPNSSDTA